MDIVHTSRWLKYWYVYVETHIRQPMDICFDDYLTLKKGKGHHEEQGLAIQSRVNMPTVYI